MADFSLDTLELMDWLIDGITVPVSTPGFMDEATRVNTAMVEVQIALIEAGGTPVAALREETNDKTVDTE